MRSRHIAAVLGSACIGALPAYGQETTRPAEVLAPVEVGGGATLDVTGPIQNGFAYRFIGDYQDTDYSRNFGTVQRSFVAPSLAWYGERTTVNVAYEHSEYKIPFDRGTVIDTRTGKPVNTPRERRLDEPYKITRGSTDLVSANVEHALNESWKIRIGGLYNHNWYKDNQARVEF